jgi:hypothetical protein
MKNLCIAFALSAGLAAPAARAAEDYGNFAALVAAQASLSTASTTGVPGGTVVNYPTLPTAPILEQASEYATDIVGALNSTTHAETSLQADLTDPDSGTVTMFLLGYGIFPPTTNGGSSSSTNFTYTFTATTAFQFDLNSTMVSSSGRFLGGQAIDYLKSIGPGAPRYVYLNTLYGDQSFQSAVLPAGQYELYASVLDFVTSPATYQGAVYTDTATLDFAIHPQAAVTTVPEAASWAMLLGGLIVVGGAMRRRRSGEAMLSVA